MQAQRKADAYQRRHVLIYYLSRWSRISSSENQNRDEKGRFGRAPHIFLRYKVFYKALGGRRGVSHKEIQQSLCFLHFQNCPVHVY